MIVVANDDKGQDSARGHSPLVRISRIVLGVASQFRFVVGRIRREVCTGCSGATAPSLSRCFLWQVLCAIKANYNLIEAIQERLESRLVTRRSSSQKLLLPVAWSSVRASSSHEAEQDRISQNELGELKIFTLFGKFSS